MRDDELWTAVDGHRALIASMVATLDDAQLSTPSLCDGWTIRDVAAHLTLQSMTLWQAVSLAARFPGPVNRMIAASSRRAARSLSTWRSSRVSAL